MWFRWWIEILIEFSFSWLSPWLRSKAIIKWNEIYRCCSIGVLCFQLGNFFFRDHWVCYLDNNTKHTHKKLYHKLLIFIYSFDLNRMPSSATQTLTFPKNVQKIQRNWATKENAGHLQRRMCIHKLVGGLHWYNYKVITKSVTFWFNWKLKFNWI